MSLMPSEPSLQYNSMSHDSHNSNVQEWSLMNLIEIGLGERSKKLKSRGRVVRSKHDFFAFKTQLNNQYTVKAAQL